MDAHSNNQHPRSRASLALLVLSLVCLSLWPVAAHAAVVPMSTDELIEAAHTIAVVDVVGNSSKTLPKPAKAKHGMIVTDTRLKVRRVLKGSASVDATITQPGGRDAAVLLVVTDQPEFVRGERCVLFVGADGGVIGGPQGKMLVEGDRVGATGLTIDELAARVTQLRTGVASQDWLAIGGIAPAPDDSAPAAASSVVAAAVPTISDILPSGQPGGIGRTVTITGTGFGTAQGTVEFVSGLSVYGTDKTAASVVSWADTSIVVTIPGRTAAGPVTVTTTGGSASRYYDLSFSTDGRHYGTLPVEFRIRENCADMAGEGAELQAAFAPWNTAGSLFRLAYGGTSTASNQAVSDGHNDIFWVNGPVGGYLAQIQYWYAMTTPPELIESNIAINESYKWGATSGSGVWDVQTVAIHELGHTVGLDDQYSNLDRAMGAGVGGTNRRSLSAAEIAGAIYLYGSDAGLPTTPTVSSSSHPSQNAWYSTGTAALAFTATSSVGIAGYSYVFDTAAGTVPDATSDTAGTSASLAVAQGERYFHVRAVNASGTAGATAHYRVRSDTSAPTGVVQIGRVGSASTSSTIVSVDSTLTDTYSTVASMALDPGTGAFGPWSAYAAHATATLTGADGTKTVRATYRDGAGNSRVDTRAIYLDTAPPVVSAFAIDGGATVTPDTRVTLSSSVGDHSQPMQMRVDAGAGYGAWVAYSAGLAVTLPAGDGVKSVSAQFRDAAGNTSPPASDDIMLDSSTALSAEVARVAGSDRYAVAANLAKTARPGYAGISHVIIASGLDAKAADPLAAAGLAGVYGAPVLLVDGSRVDKALPKATSSALAAISAANPGGVSAHVVGGTGSVPSWAMSRVDAYASIICTDRVAGDDRYKNAAAIAKRARSVLAARGEDAPTACFVTNGEKTALFPNALAVSPVAAAEHYPILLTKAGSAPSATSGEAARYSRIYVVGSTSAVSDGVRSALGATRLGDFATREGVARAVADWAIAGDLLDPTNVAVANKLPDALTGGSALGLLRGPLLFCETSSLRADSAAYLDAHRLETARCFILGGTASVTPIAETAIRSALGVP